ncbi:MAG: hypothetical protein QOK06_78 [Acidimicrobiaceae bacterium]
METLPGRLDEPQEPAGARLSEDDRALVGDDGWTEPRWWELDERSVSLLQTILRWSVDGLAVVAVTVFVLLQLGPRNLLRDTIPTGGDMGAHVWGPAYLRDHLLPHLRLSGWAPDWYDGFPAYHFYMVVPALFIVALNVGLRGWAALLPMAAVIAALVLGRRQPARSWRRRSLYTAAAVIALLGIGVPYAVAFKLISVAGLLTLPLAVYVFGRMLKLPFPTPALLTVATLVFLFNTQPPYNTGNIIGGNVTSTLAGEFSFSISLTFAVLYLGVLIAGLRTGRYRWQGAVLLALTGLCHVIPLIFALIATITALAVWPARARLRWLATTLPVGGLLTAFWFVPFVGQRAYSNDMGWEKIPASLGHLHVWDLFSGDHKAVRDEVIKQFLAPKSLWWVLAFAIVGFVISVVLRIRAGLWLGITALVMAVAFIEAPEGRLWNARLLPFYYLLLCLLAALGVAELVRAIALLCARQPERPVFAVNALAPVLALGVTLLVVGLPLMAFDHLGETRTADGSFALGPFSMSADANPAPSWAQWNYSGLENQSTGPGDQTGGKNYVEFHDLIATMQQVGSDRGCGRAMWEYDGPRLERYGTPMAPMMLSYFTDGCIGSMEGLYFEASGTTPFHFVNQAELSTKCSCAQRNLPYSGFDINLGVKHLQLLGVRYYLTATQQATTAAANHPDLTEVANSGAWHVYEVRNSALVEPLANEPAVVTSENTGADWVYGQSNPHTAPAGHPKADGPAMSWYTDPSQWNVFVAADGPASWQRVAPREQAPVRPVAATTVSAITSGDDSVSFDVSQVGTPVLVKVSYFPNWQVDGADGPYRVAPNLMVVVPTSTHVRLHYGTTNIDRLGWLLTLAGVALVVLLARRPSLAMPGAETTSSERLVGFLTAPTRQHVEPPPDG